MLKYKMQLKCFLAAFDFDYTIINDNSDSVVRQLLENVPESLEDLRRNSGWTQYMDEIFRLLHETDITETDIREAVVSIPAVPNTIEMLLNLKDMDCEVIIISDANTYFINEWLKAHNVQDCINKVYSNPAEFRDGRLFLQGYHEQNWCRLSAKNMCKSYLLFEYIAERQNNGVLFRYVSYCGDGRNDFCPTLKLRRDDIVFPRKNYCLDKLLKKTSNVTANIVPWDDTDIIQQTLQNLRLSYK